MTVRKRKLDALKRKEGQVTAAFRAARLVGLGRTSKIRIALHSTWRDAFNLWRQRDGGFFRGLPIEYDDRMSKRKVSLRGLSGAAR